MRLKTHIGKLILVMCDWKCGCVGPPFLRTSLQMRLQTHTGKLIIVMCDWKCGCVGPPFLQYKSREKIGLEIVSR